MVPRRVMNMSQTRDPQLNLIIKNQKECKINDHLPHDKSYDYLTQYQITNPCFLIDRKDRIRYCDLYRNLLLSREQNPFLLCMMDSFIDCFFYIVIL